MTSRDSTRPPYDAESEIAAVTIGSGILLTQTFALFPGLLPCLLLLLPLLVPLIVLAPPVLLLYGAWRLVAGLAERLNSRERPADHQRVDIGRAFVGHH
jgi:hypothetical protein